ncbi:MAG: hypothetical protein DDT26_01844 [Dehalococcoidia bacterium]|nr:hypothetical protein [Chloroflexota bacterium]
MLPGFITKPTLCTLIIKDFASTLWGVYGDSEIPIEGAETLAITLTDLDIAEISTKRGEKYRLRIYGQSEGQPYMISVRVDSLAGRGFILAALNNLSALDRSIHLTPRRGNEENAIFLDVGDCHWQPLKYDYSTFSNTDPEHWLKQARTLRDALYERLGLSRSVDSVELVAQLRQQMQVSGWDKDDVVSFCKSEFEITPKSLNELSRRRAEVLMQHLQKVGA